MITRPMVSAGCVAGGVEVMIGRAQLQLLEEDRIELAIVVLAGMDEHMIGRFDPAPPCTRDRRMTSGRVPTIVITFSRGIGHNGIAMRIGPLRIEHLVRPWQSRPARHRRRWLRRAPSRESSR